MKKILLASVGIMVMSAGTGYAACIPTPSCSSLGYESSSSCEGGIKCPFGNAWNCTLVNKITEIEKIIQEGGASSNKGDTSNCVVGSIFYSDWTCSYGSVIATKAPIGVVVYSDNAGHGQVMALKSIGSYTRGVNGTDLPTLQNYSSASDASKDFSSCENTLKIIADGDKETCAAPWAVQEYKTVGTSAGDWCLPAAGIFTSIYNNLSIINNAFNLTGGTQIGTGVDFHYWSSSEYSTRGAWILYIQNDFGIDWAPYGYIYEISSYEVRPVLEF